MDKLQIFSNTIVSRTSGRIVLIATLVFIIFSVTVLPDQSAKAAAYSGDAGAPDLSLFYAPEDIYRMAEQYGAAGRAAYVRARFTFDLAFPLVYGAFILAASAWAIGRLTQESSRWRLLVMIPFFAVFFDLLENTAASAVVARYPQLSPLAANLAPYFTLFKWLFVGSGFTLAILLPIIYGITRLKK